MNTKIFKTAVAACIAAMLMTGCTTSDNDVAPVEITENMQNLKVQLNASVTTYVDESKTRAGEEWAWPEGAILFVQFYNGSNVVRGHLTYMDDNGTPSWDPSFSGKLGTSDKCEIYYFDGVMVSDLHKVSLTPDNAIYADKFATYSVSDGVISVSASLAPQTGRIRFTGLSGLEVTVSGLQTYCGYDADVNEFQTTTAAVSQKVDGSSSTPYIYALFADQSEPKLCVSNSQDGDDIQFTKDFSSSILRAGESGYMTIPTEFTNKGWNTVVAVKGVSLDYNYLSMDKGDSETIEATVSPENTTDRGVVWTSSDASVATVDANGKVTGVNYGKAIITATSKQDISKTASCMVTVAEMVKTFTVSGVEFNMLHVDAGTFRMGYSADGSHTNPVHEVTLTQDYYLGETEVTQALWKAVTGNAPTTDGSQWNSYNGLDDDYPAYYISYEDVQSFIAKLNRLTGESFRMPTEAEWEFAAKGGNYSSSYTYSGSNTIGDVAWYTSNSGSKSHLVKTKSPNELGLYDMSGNVLEWCSDWYGSYSSSAQTDPTGPTSGSSRVIRGGSWSNNVANCRCVYRNSYTPSTRDKYFGFRLALPTK